MLTKDLPRGAQGLQMWDSDRRVVKSSTNAQPILQPNLHLHPPDPMDGAMIPWTRVTLTRPLGLKMMTAFTGQLDFR